jgi:hypothetical protein
VVAGVDSVFVTICSRLYIALETCMQNKAACPLMAILSGYHCRNCPSYHQYVLIRTHSSRPPLLLMHNRPISKTRSGLRVYCCSPSPGSRVHRTTSLISTASRMTTGCCTRMRIWQGILPILLSICQQGKGGRIGGATGQVLLPHLD